MDKNKAEVLKQIQDLLKLEKAQDARKLFELMEPTSEVEYFQVKGEIAQKFQNWGDAINAFTMVLEIDPENAEAKNNLHLIQNILNFWNPDMFNP